jgi:hypothetical protein
MPSGWGGHSNSTLPGLIFGQRNKLTADGPYLDLLRQFQYQLSQSKSLIVVGYSFRDEHINTYISQWLNSSWASANKITIVDPYLSKLTCEYMQILKWLPKERLNLIESPAIVALPSLFPDED